MLALCRTRAGRIELRELPLPQPQPGESLLRVRCAGICNTDLELARGYMDFHGVLGHEFVADVVESDDPRLAGQRVAGEINLACGHCALCARGLGRHCPTRSVLGIAGKDGCFAQYVTLPNANLHRLPPEIPDAAASFVEPVAACFEILEQLRVTPEDRVLVLGDGKLGQLAARVLQAHGAAPLLVGRHARKLALARDSGVHTALDVELAPKSFDVVVEATGTPGGLERAVELVRPRGSIVLKSTYHGKLTIDAAPLVIDEISVIGSRCGPFMPAIASLAAGRLDPQALQALIDATYPLSAAEEALHKAAEPGTLKVLLEMQP